MNEQPDWDKYINRDHGGVCPYCGCDDMQGHEVEISDGMARQQVSCGNPACNESWTDCYRLVRVELYQEPEEDA